MLTILVVAALAQPVGAQTGHGASHHPAAGPGLMAFHDLMEPLWHGVPGSALDEQTCGLADEIVKRAKAAAERPTPEHGALLGAANALRSACLERRMEAVPGERDRLHSAFHGLAGGHR